MRKPLAWIAAALLSGAAGAVVAPSPAAAASPARWSCTGSEVKYEGTVSYRINSAGNRITIDRVDWTKASHAVYGTRYALHGVSATVYRPDGTTEWYAPIPKPPAQPPLGGTTAEAYWPIRWQAATSARPVRVNIRSGASVFGPMPVCEINPVFWP